MNISNARGLKMALIKAVSQNKEYKYCVNVRHVPEGECLGWGIHYFKDIEGANEFYQMAKNNKEYWDNPQPPELVTDYLRRLLNIDELAEDINTEKYYLSEKIEAGIATDEEVNEAMQKEFEFAAKYF